ncbi:MAG: hypothetical protein KDD82_19390 [Planctomycetes bacterium]|nr:hypothetical protein [Planctomycetota bacterium]
MSELFATLAAQGGLSVALLGVGAVILYRKLEADKKEHAEERATLAAERQAMAQRNASERDMLREEIARLNREHLEFVQSLIPHAGDA